MIKHTMPDICYIKLLVHLYPVRFLGVQSRKPIIRTTQNPKQTSPVTQLQIIFPFSSFFNSKLPFDAVSLSREIGGSSGVCMCVKLFIFLPPAISLVRITSKLLFLHGWPILNRKNGCRRDCWPQESVKLNEALIV